MTTENNNYTVNDLIKDLQQFNPKAKILNTINISWKAPDSENNYDRTTSKKETEEVWIFDETYKILDGIDNE